MIDVVAFDYGGVLTTPIRDSIASWLDRERIDPTSFSAVLKTWMSRSAVEGTPVHRLETGELSPAEFNVLLAAELRSRDGAAVAGELLTSLFADTRPDPAMLDLVADVRAAGLRTALLSNSWGNRYPQKLFSGMFDVVVISGEIGLRKPNADIFRYLLDQLGAAAEQVAFIDDADVNTEAASRLGLHGILHLDAPTTRAALEALLAPNTIHPLTYQESL